MDFVADQLADGRRLRALTVLDLFTRECLAIDAGQGLSGRDVVATLERLRFERGLPVGKPGEPFSPIDELSAGQRCTAVFPILLKLREGPLVVDQPEDNLDNRHIAKNVAPVLVSDKRTRQIIMTSHNANLVVLSDPECIATFEATGGLGTISCAGFLSHRESEVTSHVLDILDGGERALTLRTKKYGKQRGA